MAVGVSVGAGGITFPAAVLVDVLPVGMELPVPPDGVSVLRSVCELEHPAIMRVAATPKWAHRRAVVLGRGLEPIKGRPPEVGAGLDVTPIVERVDTARLTTDAHRIFQAVICDAVRFRFPDADRLRGGRNCRPPINRHEWAAVDGVFRGEIDSY